MLSDFLITFWGYGKFDVLEAMAKSIAADVTVTRTTLAYDGTASEYLTWMSLVQQRSLYALLQRQQENLQAFKCTSRRSPVQSLAAVRSFAKYILTMQDFQEQKSETVSINRSHYFLLYQQLYTNAFGERDRHSGNRLSDSSLCGK